MKCLFCKLCGDMVCLRLNVIRNCECGNVKGKYVDTLNIAINTPYNMAVVGIDNQLLRKMSLPSYHGKMNPDAMTIFEQWGSAIVVIPAFTTNDVNLLEKEN